MQWITRLNDCVWNWHMKQVRGRGKTGDYPGTKPSFIRSKHFRSSFGNHLQTCLCICVIVCWCVVPFILDLPVISLSYPLHISSNPLIPFCQCTFTLQRSHYELVTIPSPHYPTIPLKTQSNQQKAKNYLKIQWHPPHTAKEAKTLQLFQFDAKRKLSGFRSSAQLYNSFYHFLFALPDIFSLTHH